MSDLASPLLSFSAVPQLLHPWHPTLHPRAHDPGPPYAVSDSGLKRHILELPKTQRTWERGSAGYAANEEICHESADFRTKLIRDLHVGVGKVCSITQNLGRFQYKPKVALYKTFPAQC
jgi:hypothetical protein